MGHFAFLLLMVSSLSVFSQDSCFLKNVYDPAVDAPDFKVISQKIDDYVNSFAGCRVPDFTATAIDGRVISSEKSAGKITVLNFWFTRCKPCVTEFPSLNKLAEEFSAQGVEFISFALDSKEVLDTFLISHPLKYAVVPNADSIAATFKIVVYPVNMVLDKNGTILQIFHGGAITADKALENYDKFRPYIAQAILDKK